VVQRKAKSRLFRFLLRSGRTAGRRTMGVRMDSLFMRKLHGERSVLLDKGMVTPPEMVA
jgi:hypothetical protein